MKKTLAMILICVLVLAAFPGFAEGVTGDWYADLGGAAIHPNLAEGGSYTVEIPGSDPVTGVWVLDDGYIYMDGSASPDIATIGETSLIMSDGMTFFTREKVENYAPAEPKADAPLELFAGYWTAVYVDVNDTPVLARLLNDETDLYVEGHSAILGGPVLGDTQVALTYENGALTCEYEGTKAQLQLQQDGYLRLTVTGTETAPQTWYMMETYSEALNGE